MIRAEEQLRTTRNINTEREGEEEEEEGGGKDDGKAERRSECLTARHRLWIFTHTAFENRFYSSNMQAERWLNTETGSRNSGDVM